MALPAGPLKTARDDLRLEIAGLQSIVSIASNWVQNIEPDRELLAPAEEAAFDAALTPIAQQLLAQLKLETSQTSATGLNFRIKNTLSIVAFSNRFTVSSEIAMLALTVDLDDRVFRSDLNQTFRLSVFPATNLLNWVQVP